MNNLPWATSIAIHQGAVSILTFAAINLPSLSCCCHFHEGLAALSLCVLALLLMLIHKATYVILRWEWVRVWLRQNGNPWLPDSWTQSTMLCPQNTTYDCPNSCQCLFCNKQMLLALRRVSWSWILPACLRCARTRCASCSPISVVATRPFMLFSWHPSWVLIVSCYVKRSGSAKSIHRSSWVRRRPCACMSGSSLLRQ